VQGKNTPNKSTLNKNSDSINHNEIPQKIIAKINEYSSRKQAESKLKLGHLLSNSVKLNNLSRAGRRIKKMFPMKGSSSLSSVLKDDLPNMDR